MGLALGCRLLAGAPDAGGVAGLALRLGAAAPCVGLALGCRLLAGAPDAGVVGLALRLGAAAPRVGLPLRGRLLAGARDAGGVSTTDMSQIRAVVFDWGGTLSTFADVDLEDMWTLAARHFDPRREAEIRARLHAVEAATFARSTTDQRSATLRQILEQASADLGLDVTEAVLEEAGTHYLDSWTPHIVHEPDAAPTLAAIRERGIRTGLLSNTHWPRAFHEHFLERDGLADLLDVRLYTSELTRMKPHPSVFANALDALGIDDPATAVFVGDRLHDDVFGAEQAGLKTVWRRNDLVPTFDVEPDAVVDTLAGLLEVLDRWG